LRAAPRNGRTIASIASMASRSSSAVTINAYVENAATSCHARHVVEMAEVVTGEPQVLVETGRDQRRAGGDELG
jgi:hypothetical protein